MDIKEGDILYCKKYYHINGYDLKCRVGEKYRIGDIDFSDSTYCIKPLIGGGGGNDPHIWIFFDDEKDGDENGFGYVWDYFETKIDRVKSVIKRYESRRHTIL